MKKDESVLRYVSATLAAETCILHRDGRTERIESYSPKQNALTSEENLRKAVLSLYGAEIPVLLNWNDLYFGIVNLPDKQIVTGPISLAAPIRCNFRRRGEQTGTYRATEPKKPSAVYSALLFLAEYFNGKAPHLNDFYTFNLIDKETDAIIQKESVAIQMRYNEDMGGHHTPAPIDRLEQCVKDGSIGLILDVVQDLMKGNFGITSNDAFRNEKNMSISGITNVTKAAIAGGLPFEVAYAMSDSYIASFEKCRDHNALNEKFTQACLSFTKLVYEHKQAMSDLKTQANYHCEKAKAYVFKHIQEKIEVKEIAEAIGVTPNYLSAVFRKNEGSTLSQYVMQKKISRAKRLFLYSDLTKPEIAFCLGFSSQSHFCKIFRQYTGMTPKEFTEKLKPKID